MPLGAAYVSILLVLQEIEQGNVKAFSNNIFTIFNYANLTFTPSLFLIAYMNEKLVDRACTVSM